MANVSAAVSRADVALARQDQYVLLVRPSRVVSTNLDAAQLLGMDGTVRPVCGVVALPAAAWSSSGIGRASRPTNRSKAVSTAMPCSSVRRNRSAADLPEEAAGGPFAGSATGAFWHGTGYSEHEYVLSGTAYRAMGALTSDWRWNFERDNAAGYRTRLTMQWFAKTAALSGAMYG